MSQSILLLRYIQLTSLISTEDEQHNKIIIITDIYIAPFHLDQSAGRLRKSSQSCRFTQVLQPAKALVPVSSLNVIFPITAPRISLRWTRQIEI